MAEKKNDFIPEIKKRYLDYSVSVITDRALPDLLDGLKPVQRRILYAMNELGLFSSKSFKTAARIVGEVIGKFHPHGEAAIYQAIVKLTQAFLNTHVLIKGQGNFGSLDGDNAASMRYTQIKLSKIADEFFKFLHKPITEYKLNFDSTIEEPKVLKTFLPNILLQKTSGIAVGMATEIVPHNLSELMTALIQLTKKGEAFTLSDLKKIVLGPDFVTGGIIRSEYSDLESVYTTGKGKIELFPEYEFVEGEETDKLIFSSVPINANKSQILLEIAQSIQKINSGEILSFFDDSTAERIKIIIYFSKKIKYSWKKILNYICKKTSIVQKIHISNICLYKGTPIQIGILEILKKNVENSMNILSSSFLFEKEKLLKKQHILAGLKKIYSNLDEITIFFKKAPTLDQTKAFFKETFGLDELQIKHILEFKLQKFTSSEKEKIYTEYASNEQGIAEYVQLLENEQLRKEYLVNEYKKLLQAYGIKRKTKLMFGTKNEFDYSEIIDEEILLLHLFDDRIVKISTEELKSQQLGGKGQLKNIFSDLKIQNAVICRSIDSVIFFCSNNKSYLLPAYALSSTPRGEFISNHKLVVDPNTKISSIVTIPKNVTDGFILLVSIDGRVLFSKIDYFLKNRPTGTTYSSKKKQIEFIKAIFVKNTNETIFLASKNGKLTRFLVSELRVTGKKTMGVLGMKLDKGDCVVDAGLCAESDFLLTAYAGGTGRVTPIEKYRLVSRGSKGVINTFKSEFVCSVLRVPDGYSDEFLVLTNKGYSLRSDLKNIRVVGGRSTKGVILIRLNEPDKVRKVVLFQSQ